MKKLAFLILSVSLFQWASAQYCGTSNPSACVVTGGAQNPGLYPPADSFPAFLNNFLTSATIQFQNFDTIIFGNEVLPVYSLRWDTIENLPPGLCWSTNKTDNTYGPGEAGCIHLSGLACGATGQYKLTTLVTVDIGVPVQSDGDPGGLKYFMRLENAGDADVPVDTTQTVPFISYGGICQSLTPPVVNLGADQTVCAGSIVTFSPAVTGGQPPYTYLWQSIGSVITCSTCANASAAITQNSTYILKATDASGGYGYDTINIIITGTPYNFQINAPQPSTFCAGGTVTLSANANDSLSYQWYNGNNILSTETTHALTVTDLSGAYYLVYAEAGICQATSNIINLQFYDTAVVNIISSASDTICVGGAITLTATSSTPALTYAWIQDNASLNYSSASYLAVSAGFYQVAATNATGCTDTSAGVLVVASPNFPPFISYNQFESDTMCNNTAEITLTGGEPDGGYYTGNGVLNGVFSPNAANAGLNYIFYNYIDNTGCGNSIYDTVVVLLCTAINDVSADDLATIFPNPCTDNLTIQSDLLFQRTTTVSIYDMLGKRLPLNTQHATNDKLILNLQTLSPGCYSIRLANANTQVTKRFIKGD